MYVLLHGYTDSASSYGPLCEYLPDALALTHREHGDASGVAAFMDEAGVDQAVIVGHSAGSATAQRFAVDHPERTLGVVLIGAVRSWPANPAVHELAAAVPELTDPVDRAFAREFQESMLAQPVPAGFLEMVIDESAGLPAAVWRDGIRRLATGPVPTDVGPITAPTLVVWGDRDIVCSGAEQDAHRRLRQPSRTVPSSIVRGPLTVTDPRTTTSRPKVTSPSTARRSHATSDGAAGKRSSKSRSSL